MHPLVTVSGSGIGQSDAGRSRHFPHRSTGTACRAEAGLQVVRRWTTPALGGDTGLVLVLAPAMGGLPGPPFVLNARLQVARREATPALNPPHGAGVVRGAVEAKGYKLERAKPRARTASPAAR